MKDGVIFITARQNEMPSIKTDEQNERKRMKWLMNFECVTIARPQI
ncbi:hypothetical protein CHCC20335_0725 [Bacillus paralicheniformis]|nr:hypothetical protein CHCC20335_0725 [Bacillus paralicheniformis]